MKAQSIREYFCFLAQQHCQVRHNPDGDIHFSSLLEEAQNLYARKMHYPCVVLNTADYDGFTSNIMSRTASLLFLDHCKDSGDYDRVKAIFDTTENIMKDFIRRMMRDKAKGEPVVSRISQEQMEAHQIYLESAGLYGWALFFVVPEFLNTKDCDNVFEDGK